MVPCLSLSKGREETDCGVWLGPSHRGCYSSCDNKLGLSHPALLQRFSRGGGRGSKAEPSSYQLCSARGPATVEKDKRVKGMLS